MKKILFAFIIMAVSLTSYGQKDEIVKKMVEYGFSEKNLDIKISQEDPNYSFKMKTTTKTNDDTKVEEASFDPSRAEGQKWKLETVNGNAPSLKDLKNFNKDNNNKMPNFTKSIINNLERCFCLYSQMLRRTLLHWCYK